MNDESQDVMSVQNFTNDEEAPSTEDGTALEPPEAHDKMADENHNPETEANAVIEGNDDEDDMDELAQDSQDIVMGTIEQELGMECGSLDPGVVEGTAAEESDSEEQEDTAMADNDDQLHGMVDDDAMVHDVEEQQNSMNEDTQEDDERMRASQPQMEPNGASNFQPSQVNGDDVDNDSSTLFVPELPPSTPRPSMHHGVFSNMPPPSRPSTTPSVPGNSTYARIRNMQKKLADKKNADIKRQAAQRFQANPDDEAYLEAILSPITPPASMPRPKVDEDEVAHRQAKAEYLKKRHYYDELRRKNGKLTFRQDVEWMKVKGAEAARLKKRTCDLAKAHQEEDSAEPDLFPESRLQTEDRERAEDSEDLWDIDSFGSSNKRRRREMPQKLPKMVSMQEAELQSMRVALEADEDLPKKKKRKGQTSDDESQDTRAGAKGKGKGKGKAAAKPKPTATRAKAGSKVASGGRKTAKEKRTIDHAIKQASSLFNANVFEQQAGEGERDQPTFRTRNKTDALKELIASVPLEEKKQARTDMNVLLAATKDFDGYGSVKLDGGNWVVKGMKTSLKGYQVLGSAFMRRRENAADEPKGGLMADQMGLGKTLMMLANIVNGQPPKGQHPRTTLLVASPALLTQWAKEIEQHTNYGLKIMRYSSGNRLDSNQPFEVLKHHDIILTTYHEIMRSYPKNEPPIDCQTAEQKIAWWKSVYENQRGVLHRMMFLRVVLDEAQAIKSHISRTSIACRALMAKHKWALSGTPILNSLTELYPYFKFLGVPHTGSFKIFKHNYCDTKDSENTERLLVRLSQFMIRRTHADRMFNAPILKLPQADQGTFWCEFNPVERCVYDIVRQRFAKNINMWQQKGELEKSYSNALVMLLRLRQLTAHILMLQFVMRDLLEVEDIERIKEVVQEQSADKSTQTGSTIIAIRKQLEKHAIEQKKKSAIRAAKAAAKAAAKEAGREDVHQEDASEEEAPELEEEEEYQGQPTGQVGAGKGGSGKTFGKDYNFKPFLRSLKAGDSWEKAKKRAKCSWCDKPPKNPWIASCGHLICDRCLEISNLTAAEDQNERAPCKACGFTPTSVMTFEMTENEEFEPVARGTRSKKGAKAAKQPERRDREDIAEDWLSYAGEEVLPSAKTLAIKAQVLNWTREDPKVKIIIYTQFLAMIRILAKICQKEGWQAEQYMGTMSFAARDKAISNFATNEKCNILLASLRSGGLGLNLTMASRVIMVDPWWNSASEQQAFCRVFRIGQKEETYMSRLCVKNTVDTRLMDMQERKEKEISEVMEDDGERMKKMSIVDLMRLFGNLDEDAEGKPFILVDNPDPRGGFRADRDDEGFADEI
ncbi:SNF2 family N-terminal domain-containing protein [Paraphoma chrysanthemicola]|uniref:SNF2 family N-terminal domain-containing protein n=1 Tax=Paraphoma chrysanthemicola TaxID=798071 RepID=A0A8K0W0M8_9PLEO|nr:SNF2 family N-terminal domain-containing protein [Paraphoma chrysanthemicola]